MPLYTLDLKAIFIIMIQIINIDKLYYLHIYVFLSIFLFFCHKICFINIT